MPLMRDLELTPEAELLIAGCTPAAQAAPSFLDRPRPGIDWDAVCRLATAHRVAPILYRRLSADCAERVPADALERLKREFHRNLLRARYLAGELAKLMDALESSGIEALTYKGPTLALMAYGDAAMRQFVDLDVLVRDTDVAMAAKVLAAQGYSRATDYNPRDTTVLKECEDAFFGKDGIGVVDLHWRIMPRNFPFAPEPAALLAGARRIAIGHSAVMTLSHAHMMLVLCAHSTKHGWVSLSDLCDIAGMVRANRAADWSEALEKAGPIGARRMVLVGFHLAHELLGAEFADGIVRIARDDRKVTELAGRVARRLLAPRAEVEPLSQPWLVPLLSIERTGQRVRYCVDRALAPTDKESKFVALPRALLPLHYLTRPMRLGLKLKDHLAARLRAPRARPHAKAR